MGDTRSASFEGIEVHPYYRLFEPSIGELSGGPNWPDFSKRTFERHNRFGRPIDSEFESSSQKLQRISGKSFWVGPVVDHFGHQLLDFSTRLAWATKFSPNGHYLISSLVPSSHLRALNPRRDWHYSSIPDIPLYIRNIFNWFGVTENRIHLVNEPVIVDELQVFEQGEQFMVSPSDSYLDELDQWRLRWSGIRTDLVYVSRTRLASPFGRLMGEKAIEAAFALAGFKVVYPELIPISLQARIYGGAKKIVFAEGSAVHGLGLLGRIEASVFIINRRKTGFDSSVYEKSIAPRSSHFATIDSLVAAFPDENHWRSVSVLEPELLIAKLLDLGVDLRGHLIPVNYWNSVGEDFEQIDKTVEQGLGLSKIYTHVGPGTTKAYSDFASFVRHKCGGKEN